MKSIDTILTKIAHNEKITRREYNYIIRHRLDDAESKTFDEWVKSEINPHNINIKDELNWMYIWGVFSAFILLAGLYLLRYFGHI